MPKRDLITLSKIYNNIPTCYRAQYLAIKPRESEAMRLGREIHENFEWDRANSPAPITEPLFEDKAK